MMMMMSMMMISEESSKPNGARTTHGAGVSVKELYTLHHTILSLASVKHA